MNDVGTGSVGRWSVGLQMGQFALAGLVALALVGLSTTVATRRIGEREAITDARSDTVAKAFSVVQPRLRDGLLTGDPQARALVSSAVNEAVIDDQLVRVKIWAADGRILFSNDSALIGQRFPLGAEEAASLRTGAIIAEISDLAKPENDREQGFGRLLEVYLPIETPDGTMVLFEAYHRYDAVADAGRQLWRAFAPLTLGALLLLQLVQLPLAWSLARRLRQRLQERTVLLQRSIDASDSERRQIASDLHDGVVQDLAGVAYALSGAAREVGSASFRSAALLEASAEQVRGSITQLRTLLVDIYPPNLEDEGLESALTALVASATARGLEVDLDTRGVVDDLSPDRTRLLYRGLQEALRNVVRHAEAGAVRMTVQSNPTTVRASGVDVGRGFDPTQASQPGHLGLRGLAGMLHDAGGSLDVCSTISGGTEVTIEVPR